MKKSLPELSQHMVTIQQSDKDGLPRVYEDYKQQRTSQAIIRNTSVRCPGCGIYVSSIGGCSHVRSSILNMADGDDFACYVDDLLQLPASVLLWVRREDILFQRAS